MPATSESTRAMPRRAEYAPRFYRPDYFLLRGVNEFLMTKIPGVVKADAVVADVGCGEQPLRFAIEDLGAQYVGLDVIQNSAGTVDRVCDIGALQLDDASVDVVVCTEVVEHVPDIRGAIVEMARILRPGGVILLTTPFAYPLHEEPFDHSRPTPYHIEHCARAAGLSCEVSKSGNEIEAAATLLDNMWSRMGGKSRGVMMKAMTLLFRLTTNSAAWLAERALGQRMPRKSYLSTLAVLRKPT